MHVHGEAGGAPFLALTVMHTTPFIWNTSGLVEAGHQCYVVQME